MARIAGIDLPKNKRGVVGLTYIFGIGRSTSKKILKENSIDETLKFKIGMMINCQQLEIQLMKSKQKVSCVLKFN